MIKNLVMLIVVCALAAPTTASTVLLSGGYGPFAKVSDPVLSGTPTALNTLTIIPGVYSGSLSPTRTYQEFRDAVAVARTYSVSTGAPWSYIINEDNVGHTVTFKETVIALSSGFQITSAASNGVGVVAALTPNATGVTDVVASGNLQIDSLLNGSRWKPSPSNATPVVTYSFPQSTTDYGCPGTALTYLGGIGDVCGVSSFTGSISDTTLTVTALAGGAVTACDFTPGDIWATSAAQQPSFDGVPAHNPPGSIYNPLTDLSTSHQCILP